MPSHHGSTLMRRPQRRASLVAAAARAFARTGFAATSLDDVAEEAGVSRVLIYRHFDSKAELYETVLTDFRDALVEATGAPDRLDESSIDRLVTTARDQPDEFRLFFRHAATEPRFSRHTDWLRQSMVETARPYLREMISDPNVLTWCELAIPTVAIDAVLTWLDAGCPQPETAPARIQQMISGVVEAMQPSPPGQPESDDA